MINNSKNKNLEQVLKTRSAIAERLNDIVKTVETAEITGQNRQKKLELEAAIADLKQSSASKNN